MNARTIANFAAPLVATIVWALSELSNKLRAFPFLLALN